MATMMDFYETSPTDRKSYDDDVSNSIDEDIFSDFTSEFSTDFGAQAHVPTKLGSNNPFANSIAFEHPNMWADTTESSTPMGLYDSLATDFEPPSAFASHHSHMSFDVPSGNHIRPISVFPPPQHTAIASAITSPHHGAKDWMSSLASEQQDLRSLPKRMRPGSPRSTSPLVRRAGDGIRKKNARFEIPAERNLTNIDNLISQSNDDQEIKELKQQKRLLRNRQAALDSRQRKKQHTERLEEEKKTYTDMISELEEKVQRLEIQQTEHLDRESKMATHLEECTQHIYKLMTEKDNMLAKHTQETRDLRKKNAVLFETVQSLELAGPSVQTPTNFADDFMVDSWDSFLCDFPPDATYDAAAAADPAPSKALVPVKKEKITISEEDKPVASSLLLVLLLCGALVASKGATSTPAIPQMSDDIRAASATVLDSIFKDAGVASAQPQLHPAAAHTLSSLEPAPSHGAWPAPQPTLLSSSIDPSSSSSASVLDTHMQLSSSLDMLNHQLTAPTKDQQTAQLFSITPEQYDGITSHDFLARDRDPGRVAERRRHLDAGLAAMRERGKGSAAEVYTRSLLLDKVPTEVVRDFAKMVASVNRGDGADE